MIYLRRFSFLLLSLLSLISASWAQVPQLYKGRGYKNIERQKVYPNDTLGVDPFVKAKHIELISYPNRTVWWDCVMGDNYPLVKEGQLTIPKDSIRYRISILKTDFQIWQHAIYDPYSCQESMVSGCYFPRHMLLFYDRNDKIFGYIEICVECVGLNFSIGLKTTVNCPERTSGLKALLKPKESFNKSISFD